MGKVSHIDEKVLPELKVSKQEAEQKLQKRIEKGQELLKLPITNQLQLSEVRREYKKWDEYNNEYLRRIFSTEEEAKKYSRFRSASFPINPPFRVIISNFLDDVKEKIHRIESIIERLELISLDSSSNNAQTDNKNSPSNKVFIVHGRDELAKTNLEILLQDMGLETIVLHRQADEGQTVIEKFEKHGKDVGYAFILLTPDEIAYLESEESLADQDRKKEKRARPNVIFEFGYFIGSLGRNRVCCLYTGGVMLPSDLSGFVYKQYNNSVEEVAWSIQKDLKAIGIIN
ncbi:TIR domain-containing protein [Sulfurovum sp. AR]|uniref:TIR domain-containing protein n=1 Tax=Sulfurovum sp. AR TaxID=1165841 RepID=UPI00025C484B|nr:nucleotide-binding protein [Sulfurovum sp. AR]EIF50450.1 nucleotide-binding protein [Sulfurovum sp. AR]